VTARSRGPSSRPTCRTTTVRFLQHCPAQGFNTTLELGIKNVHAHKGPTIWPLDKDAVDVSDVDHAATDFPDLNFIVEHVGLPRIEDFGFMATQEPNVYAGLSVIIGGLMHAATLGTVRDPELDEPVTELGFVASATVSCDGVATVHLRLPTYFCAPGFAFPWWRMRSTRSAR